MLSTHKTYNIIEALRLCKNFKRRKAISYAVPLLFIQLNVCTHIGYGSTDLYPPSYNGWAPSAPTYMLCSCQNTTTTFMYVYNVLYKRSDHNRFSTATQR